MIEKYPLEQIITVKKDRVDKAEKILIDKKRALEIEEEKLKKVEKERDVVLNHHNDKLKQLRQSMDEGTTSDEILQMKAYLKIVKQNLIVEEEKVKKQAGEVKKAKQAVEDARKELQARRLELEKVKMHKVEWKKGEAREERKKEEKVEDELGASTYEKKRKKEI